MEDMECQILLSDYIMDLSEMQLSFRVYVRAGYTLDNFSDPNHYYKCFKTFS